MDDNDRHRFIVQLTESLDTYQVVLHAYILMHNHFHLLAQTRRANLAEFMRRFNICYTGWFNYRHGQCGHLYQGRYKSFLVDAESYLLEVSRYLHLNYVRRGKFKSESFASQWQIAREYRWSSLRGYISKRMINTFVDYDLILSMVGGRRAYQNFITDGMMDKTKSPFENNLHSGILGNDDFVARVRKEYIKQGSVRDQPAYRNLITKNLPPEFIIQCVVDSCKCDVLVLQKRRAAGVERGIASEMLYRYGGLTEREIGDLLGGIDYSAVHKLRWRLKVKMTRDKKIENQFSKVNKNIQKLMSNVEI